MVIPTAQRKLIVVKLSDGKGMAQQPALAVAATGPGGPPFRNIVKKKLVYIACWVVVLMLLLCVVVGIAASRTGIAPDFLQVTDDYPCLGYSVPATVMTFTGVTSLLLWELNVVLKVPHLANEITSHRIFRLLLLTVMGSLGMINSFLCDDAYMLLLELFLILFFIMAEFTYHVMLVVYIWEFQKFVHEQYVQNIAFLKREVTKAKADGNAEKFKDYMDVEAV